MKDNTIKAQAKDLLSKLEKERADQGILGKDLKEYKTTEAVLSAAPEVQVAVVEQVVDVFSALGAETAPNAHYWWGTLEHPWTSAKLAELLLRKRLPCTDAALAAMLENLAGIGLLTTSVVPCLERLVVEVENRAAEGELSPRLRKAVRRIGDELSGEKLSRAAERLWKQEEHAPVALDRKLAGRIERMLMGPIDLAKR
jgi:hypothetical protein